MRTKSQETLVLRFQSLMEPMIKTLISINLTFLNSKRNKMLNLMNFLPKIMTKGIILLKMIIRRSSRLRSKVLMMLKRSYNLVHLLLILTMRHQKFLKFKRQAQRHHLSQSKCHRTQMLTQWGKSVR
jgi:hypothetical protein